jgi:hypothetical protein
LPLKSQTANGRFRIRVVGDSCNFLPFMRGSRR